MLSVPTKPSFPLWSSKFSQVCVSLLNTDAKPSLIIGAISVVLACFISFPKESNASFEPMYSFVLKS